MQQIISQVKPTTKAFSLNDILTLLEKREEQLTTEFYESIIPKAVEGFHSHYSLLASSNCSFDTLVLHLAATKPLRNQLAELQQKYNADKPCTYYS